MGFVLPQIVMGGLNIKRGIKMNVDKRIKMVWLQTCGTGNTISVEEWLNEMERIL